MGGLLSFTAANVNAGFFGTLQGDFCAMADELAFNFCGESECEGDYLAGDVVAEAKVVLDCPDAGISFLKKIEGVHYHQETPAQA